MLTNILVGTLMMVLTTGVHSIFTVIIFFVLRYWVRRGRSERPSVRLAVISGTILIFFCAALVEVAMWAAAYLGVGAVGGLEPALYFSMVTFTTLGFGDIVLEGQWRLLASLEAANGIIMFGWTTAVVMAVVQRTFATLLAHIRHGKETSGS